MRSHAAEEFASEQGGWSGGTTATIERTQESAEEYLQSGKIPVVYGGDVGIGVSYEVDLFGKIRRGIEAAQADSQAMEAAKDVVKVAVVADVVRAYVESCSAAEEQLIAEESLSVGQLRADAMRKLRDAGRVAQIDVSKEETKVSILRAGMPVFAARRRIAQYKLAALLSRAPSDLPPAVFSCHDVPELLRPMPIGDSTSMLRRRPDVRQAERKLAAATARIGVAVAELYPSITIGASAGSTGILGDLLSPSTNHWALGPLINWTFPENGQRARVRMAQAQAGGALAELDGAVLNALRETQTSLAAYSADYQRVVSLQTAYESEMNTLAQTRRLQAAGRESVLSTLDASGDLASLHASLAAQQGQVALDQVQLFEALGGGWAQKEDQNRAAPLIK
ncbi:efflux transporter, outer membrane factor (OMF) lipoprotein, NodT family [Paraburkholderia lycopersici]|uniref:Efflux transporter, outer membrane factor (OMF) lipoprotein, NodT family n=2 Tax=Paraburkholderia lycopersici TaxID=416944 RepID=A0A1G7A133_9BURK|nr:efflux transporter, outer membrane factor (OMF) lipoprotein, NodT family [Paraburkholderia lycopersici]